ncbi:hypothetical protein [Melghirimyces algeriensis]|uniref:Uncharacterized protein n=1 Tax=Melghirimyces algeriensis TaxID=910412 RepID=A0A521BUW2_9BACL|nr:hypothetical protein [Melghirimyces algeriensis]SMO50974.1 hypothetical protein SAMN06264849_102459 [Melghirimyces algeriensis]
MSIVWALVNLLFDFHILKEFTEAAGDLSPYFLYFAMRQNTGTSCGRSKD